MKKKRPTKHITADQKAPSHRPDMMRFIVKFVSIHPYPHRPRTRTLVRPSQGRYQSMLEKHTKNSTTTTHQ